MPDLLLELFSEEIPARMQRQAERDLAELFKGAMAKEGFAGLAPVTFSTPRRIALMCAGIPAAQPDVTAELKGPKTTAPEAALAGFLKKTGLTRSDLAERDGVYFAVVHQKGKPTAGLLKLLIEGILQNFPWPKSMRWGSGEVTWVRPLHSILCIFDGKVVPVQFGGVKAGNVTYGHRFLSPEEIVIADPAEYESKLEKAHVIASRDKRKADILKQAEKVAASKNLVLRKDEGLLEEVTGLVEWPVALMGAIDAEFVDIPTEVRISEMRAHQKYFALVTKEGALSDKFLITSNMVARDDGKAIVAGNERVLRARLSDGRFFWDQDRKKPLSEWAKELKNVIYHAKLGTVADKAERIKALALQLADYVKADKKLVQWAATLCKADLVTGMVGEFPDLQGVMGCHYALKCKEAREMPNALWGEIAFAIQAHYLPLGPTSPVPTTPVSICVALADKLDTLVSMFAIGEKPTGSKDPFALRRAALGVIRIVLERNVRISLYNIMHNTISTVLAKLTPGRAVRVPQDTKNIAREVITFFIDRLKVQLKDSGIRHDVINAVVADGDDDLVRIVARAKALQEFLSTANGANLLIAYKRAANIVAIEEKKDKTSYQASIDQIALIGEQAEVDLIHALEERDSVIPPLLKDEAYDEVMQFLALLRREVDGFFDGVMVNCEDKELRLNRLHLLSCIRNIMNMVADFSLIEG